MFESMFLGRYGSRKAKEFRKWAERYGFIIPETIRGKELYEVAVAVLKNMKIREKLNREIAEDFVRRFAFSQFAEWVANGNSYDVMKFIDYMIGENKEANHEGAV